MLKEEENEILDSDESWEAQEKLAEERLKQSPLKKFQESLENK